MAPDEFLEAMQKIASEQGGDEEAAHSSMDDLMCELLCSLGYEDGVTVFHDQAKWYA